MAELHSIARPTGLPKKIGRYRVLCELGTGSMASLYLGRAGGLGGFERLFALKVVHPHLCRKPAFIDMFLNEARIAASVHHPNVVPVYEIDVDDGQYFLAMDYVSGETLALLLRSTWHAQRDLPMRFAAHIVASAAEGLHAAHELTDAEGASRNVVHRDVAPQNIMIGYDGIVRVTDFGIAKAMDSVSQTKPGVLKGTVAYMSPEQVRGQELDRRVDVFALGVLLWEATLGLRLFKDKTELRTAGRILRMAPPPPTSMHDDYPEALEHIVMKALAKDSDERYPTARALSEDLFAYLATEERVTASEMEKFLGEVFSKRLEQRRALERDAAETEPPENLGDHLSDASQTLGLEHFTAQQAFDEFDPDELEAEGLNELGAALREKAAISDIIEKAQDTTADRPPTDGAPTDQTVAPEASNGADSDRPETKLERPRVLPRNIVEKNHATTSKMPLPRFDSGPKKVLSPKSILPSGRVNVEVAPTAEAKKSILPRKKKDDDPSEEALGSAIEKALEVAPIDLAADAPTLDEEPTDGAAVLDAKAFVAVAEELPLASESDVVQAVVPAEGAFDEDAPEAIRLKSELDAPAAEGEDVENAPSDAPGEAETETVAEAEPEATSEEEAESTDEETTKEDAAEDTLPFAEATPAELVFAPAAEKSGPVPKFSQRDVQTALIRDTGPIPVAPADVVEILPEDTKRVANPLPPEETSEPDLPLVKAVEPEAEAAAEPKPDPEDELAEPDDAFQSIAEEERNARRTRVVALAVGAVLLLVTVFALWPSGSEPEPVAAASEAAPTDVEPEATADHAEVEAPAEPEEDDVAPTPEPELVAPRPLTASAPPAPAVVSIRVEATPQGAEVLFDGRPYTGPVELDRSEGEHVVRVQAPGHRPQMVIVNAEEDRVVRVALESDAPEPVVERRKKRRRRRRTTTTKKKTRKKTGAILFDGDDL
ncbi:MAG: protein kinase [Deltaproteobacteria bacterium]